MEVYHGGRRGGGVGGGGVCRSSSWFNEANSFFVTSRNTHSHARARASSKNPCTAAEQSVLTEIIAPDCLCGCAVCKWFSGILPARLTRIASFDNSWLPRVCERVSVRVCAHARTSARLTIKQINQPWNCGHATIWLIFSVWVHVHWRKEFVILSFFFCALFFCC